MNEVWKTITDYPEYEVSNLGNIRSVDREFYDNLGRHYFKKGQMIKLEHQNNEDGYIQIMVHIWSGKKEYRLIVARLVATAFIPNPHNYSQVNHKDENSLNNNIDNLEWCTCKYNINYKDLVARRSKKKRRSIDVYDKQGEFLETLSSGVEASRKYNVSRGMISQCCNQQINSAKGFYFKFHS